MSGRKDSVKNKIITNLSLTDEMCFYKINVEEKVININKQWKKYIINNQNIIYGWFNYKLVCYLQKRNPNVPAIPFKLQAPKKRDLSKGKKFWDEVRSKIVISDIYTGKELLDSNFSIYGGISIDHFIPWSFVLHDELWNLVPTFSTINSSKSNKLPEINIYMDRFSNIQFEAFNLIRSSKYFKSYCEDYLNINKSFNIDKLKDSNTGREEFKQSLKSTIEPLYQIAYNQGYDIWKI